jgi:putative ABC transport system permease protein
MLRNYFITAWRNLAKNRLNTFINILGLAVAFTCSILLFLAVHYEFSYDGFHKGQNRLFEVYGLSHKADGDDKGSSMGFPVAPSMKSDVAGVVRATDMMFGGAGIRYKDKEIDKGIALVDNDFFKMFSFPILRGDKSGPLLSPNQLVMNQTTADAVFGKEDPIGKMVKVKIGREWKDLMVSAVIADAPGNSSIRYDNLARIELYQNYPQEKTNWNIQHHPVFIELAPGTPQAQAERGMRAMIKKYKVVDEEDLKKQGYHKDANGDYFALDLAPFTTLHFDQQLSPGRRAVGKPYLYTLILISIVVMVIACFNFINLNVARSFTRAREVGVRKAIGAGKAQIFFQLWTESFLLCVLSVIIALGASTLLLEPFNGLFSEKLTLDQLGRLPIVLSVFAGLLLVSFLAGGYPAWLVARFRVVEVLKGKVSVNRSSLLRNGLITFQFVMASLLICSTIVIYRQFQYLREAPLGYEQESVISIPVKKGENAGRYIASLRSRLQSEPQVLTVTGSSVNIGIGEDHSQSNHGLGFDYKGQPVGTELIVVDYDYLRTLGIHPLKGRDFSRDFPSDTSSRVNNVVVTESMAAQFGVKDAVGLSFYPGDSASPRWTIIGVIPDIHVNSMREKIFPLTLQMRKAESLNYILVRVKTTNPREAMHLVQTAYKELEPDNSINASWLSENTRRWYEAEERLSTIFFSAAGIAILLSCLGLFAIVLLVMEQRRREIGVRKVLGASIAQISGLLAKDFIWLVLLAFVLATPIAWYFLNRWLLDFPYRISIGWWIFPAAGLLTLLIALATIGVQTLKAALANPVESLRSE